MCGVSGILHKNLAAKNNLPAIGDQLIRMLEPLTHRGKDSSGVTIVGEDAEADFIVRIWTDNPRKPRTCLLALRTPFAGLEELFAPVGTPVSFYAWQSTTRVSLPSWPPT